jgi:uncharacterized protein YggE
MKKTFLILAALLCAVTAKAEAASRQDGKQIFYVSADAEIYVKPDRVHLTLGVLERSEDLRTGKESMSETLKKAIAFCKANGIQDKHIQTSYISIYPEYRYDDDKAKSLLRHYTLNQTFTVTLENPDIYETILYSLLDMGINNVHNVSFTTSELRRYRDEARLAAVKAAQEKAKLLAGAAGLKLRKVINIQEGLLSDAPIARRMPGAVLSNASQNISQMSSPADTGEGFAIGTIPVRAAVTLAYELK